MSDLVTLLFIGDIVGKPGRAITRLALPRLVARHGVDLVIANVENAAGGNGITREIGETLLDYGVQVMTTGNHVWDKKEAIAYIENQPRLLRPGNYPAGVPGRGHCSALTPGGVAIGVVNVMGRIFMNPLDNPFHVVRGQIETVRAEHGARIVFVDFHAEATSEKKAMGWHLDGEVTVVAGTHTHVQTADERILPNGTAYITDVGMTGPPRFDHRRRSAAGPEAIPRRHAGQVRYGDTQSKGQCHRRDRRSRNGAGPHHQAGGSLRRRD